MVAANFDKGRVAKAPAALNAPKGFKVSGPMVSSTQTAAQAAANPGYTGVNLNPAAATPTAAAADPAAEEKTVEDPYVTWAKEQEAAAKRARSKNAQAIMSAQMEALGLQGLASQITTWITEGYEPEALNALVRQTPEYAARFPAMKALQARGQTMTEGQYVAYEQTMVEYERMYGLPTGMLSGKDMVTKSLTNGLSALEIEQRSVRASASMYSLPSEFRTTMQNYYGIDSGGLTAYFLDPDVASPLLEKQYVSAQIGMEASRQRVDIAATLAEQLYAGGITREKAAVGFEKVAGQAGLSVGKGDAVTQGTLIDANLMGTASSQQQVDRTAGSRVARFAGGGAFVGDRQGVRGLGSAAE